MKCRSDKLEIIIYYIINIMKMKRLITFLNLYVMNLNDG